jgi:hypothetical protein
MSSILLVGISRCVIKLFPCSSWSSLFLNYVELHDLRSNSGQL